MITKLKNWIKSKHKNANHEAKMNQTISGVCLMVVFFLGFMLFNYVKHKNDNNEGVVKKNYAGVFDKKFNSTTDEALFEKQHLEIKNLSSNYSKFREKDKKSFEQHQKKTEENNKNLLAVISTMNKRVEKLEQENLTSKAQIVKLKREESTHSSELHIENKGSPETSYKPINFESKPLRHVRLLREKSIKHVRTPRNYVWAGTQVEGFLLTGVIADAGINGDKNKSSGVIRLVSNGRMPNKKHSYLKDCIVTYSGYGDLSASTAVLHVGRLSCASPLLNFEKKVFGSVYDTDAMQDLRGTPILNTKPLLSYSTAAGIIGGVGDTIKSAGTIQTITPNGNISTSSLSLSDIAKQGAGGGITNGANKVADYVMKIADIYHPVVAIKPGRRVTVIFLRGFWLDDNQEHAESTPQNNVNSQKYTHAVRPVNRVAQNKKLDELLKANPSLNAPLYKGA